MHVLVNIATMLLDKKKLILDSFNTCTCGNLLASHPTIKDIKKSVSLAHLSLSSFLWPLCLFHSLVCRRFSHFRVILSLLIAALSPLCLFHSPASPYPVSLTTFINPHWLSFPLSLSHKIIVDLDLYAVVEGRKLSK
jgi:hypothetical protein